MNFANTTPEVASFFTQLISTGQLINFYSDEYAKAHESIGNINTERLRELDEEFGDSYRNHLLVFFNDDNTETILKLINCYPVLASLFEPDKIKFNFIFINLSSQQLYCIGIARKGAVYEKFLNIDGSEFDADNSNFFSQDHEDISGTIVETLEEIANGNHGLFSGEIDEGVIDECFEAGPREDGLYYIFGEDDEDGVSLEELQSRKNYLMSLSDDIHYGISNLKGFFPLIEISNDDFVVDY